MSVLRNKFCQQESHPPITQTPNNLNLFLFPLKVRVIGSQLYCSVDKKTLFVFLQISKINGKPERATQFPIEIQMDV